MNLPGFLADRPTHDAENVLQATSVTVLNAFQKEGLILSMELEYGYEDLPLLATLAGILRDNATNWHKTQGGGTDFRILQRGFTHAFLSGLDLAAQLHFRENENLSLDAKVAGVLEGTHSKTVPAPLAELTQDLKTSAENAFVTFQNQSLAIAASSKNETLMADFFACGCLWAALAGVETGSLKLDALAAT